MLVSPSSSVPIQVSEDFGQHSSETLSDPRRLDEGTIFALQVSPSGIHNDTEFNKTIREVHSLAFFSSSAAVVTHLVDLQLRLETSPRMISTR